MNGDKNGDKNKNIINNPCEQNISCNRIVNDDVWDYEAKDFHNPRIVYDEKNDTMYELSLEEYNRRLKGEEIKEKKEEKKEDIKVNIKQKPQPKPQPKPQQKKKKTYDDYDDYDDYDYDDEYDDEYDDTYDSMYEKCFK